MAQFLYGKKCKLPNLAFAVPVSPNSTFAEQGSGFADYKKSWKGLGKGIATKNVASHWFFYFVSYKRGSVQWGV
jgi:hypothetical protein